MTAFHRFRSTSRATHMHRRVSRHTTQAKNSSPATPEDGLDFGCVLYRSLSIDFVKCNGQERETHSV